jgi:hypothetical protein
LRVQDQDQGLRQRWPYPVPGLVADVGINGTR